MKSIRPYLISLLLVLTLTACQNDYQKHLRLLVNSLNEECPIPLGAIGHMDKAEYDGATVTFHYTLTGVFDIQSFSANQEQFHQYMLDNYRSNSDESFRQLIGAIVKAEANLKVVFSSHHPSFHLPRTLRQYAYIHGRPRGLSTILSSGHETPTSHDLLRGNGMLSRRA